MDIEKCVDLVSQAKMCLASAKKTPKYAQEHIEIADKFLNNVLILLTSTQEYQDIITRSEPR